MFDTSSRSTLKPSWRRRVAAIIFLHVRKGKVERRSKALLKKGGGRQSWMSHHRVPVRVTSGRSRKYEIAKGVGGHTGVIAS